MKILLDENLPVKLKYKLEGFNAYTVYDMGWDSFKNGKLLNQAIENGFDIFITTDKNLQYQQNIPTIAISFIVLDVLLLKWLFIEPLIPSILDLLPNVEKGKVYIVKLLPNHVNLKLSFFGSFKEFSLMR